MQHITLSINFLCVCLRELYFQVRTGSAKMADCERYNYVPSLEDLAFEVFFEKIVHKLTPNTAQFVHDLIDDHLVGRVKYDVRYNFIYFQFMLITVKYR